MLYSEIHEISSDSSLDGKLLNFSCDQVVKKMNLKNFEHRSVIKDLSEEGIALKNIYESLANVNSRGGFGLYF